MTNLLKKRKLNILGNERYISMPIQYTNIDKLIGLGCYSVVFKSILNTEYESDSDSNEKTKKVAIKKIYFYEDEYLNDSVILELSLMLHFRKSDHIVNIIDYWVDIEDNSLFISMEKMTCNIKKLILDNTLFTLYHILLITYQILQGLHVLHESEIIHRDIKPENILIDSNLVVKIADLGSACIFSKYKNNEKNLSFCLVTKSYRSIELLFGNTNYSYSVDMWSLGCIIFELFNKYELFNLIKNEYELLIKMINIFSYPSNDDLIDINNNELNLRLKQLGLINNLQFINIFKNINDSNLLYLTFNLLQLNPKKRFNTTQALNIFKNVKQSFLNTPISKFDYQDFLDRKEEIKTIYDLQNDEYLKNIDCDSYSELDILWKKIRDNFS